jgi:hypothetical protein
VIVKSQLGLDWICIHTTIAVHVVYRELAAAVDIAQLKRGTVLIAQEKIVEYLRVFSEGLDREVERAV